MERYRYSRLRSGVTVLATIMTLAAGQLVSAELSAAYAWNNNGLGNGDQRAPGNSLTHNGAENNTSNTTGTGNPPGSGKFGVNPN
jgi:hypothetical protein